MAGLIDFFGSDEWRAMFLASLLLSVVTVLFLISRVFLWVATIIFILAMLFTGYKLFFSKKKTASLSAQDFKTMFKR